MNEAQTAIDNDAPNVFELSPDGKVVKGFSTSFVEWARAHGITPEEASQRVLTDLPPRVMFLAQASDPRSIPLLRRALLSQNFLIQVFAASGLAELNDKDSIPFIISACNASRTEIAPLIAESLAFFDDSLAEEALFRFVPSDQAASLIKARRQGKKPFNK